MKNPVHELIAELALDQPAQRPMALAFGLACTQRVRAYLEDTQVLACLDELASFVAGQINETQLRATAERAAALANRHPGSRSLDGVGHAAVSATYAVAHALAGKALTAADYAAYAMVYGQGGYGAVADLESFVPEQQWQVQTLLDLARRAALGPVNA